jgi:hypothetical protein
MRTLGTFVSMWDSEYDPSRFAFAFDKILLERTLVRGHWDQRGDLI